MVTAQQTYKLGIFRAPVRHSSINSFVYLHTWRVGVYLVRCNQSLNSTNVCIHEPAAHYCLAGDIFCLQQSSNFDLERTEIEVIVQNTVQTCVSVVQNKT